MLWLVCYGYINYLIECYNVLSSMSAESIISSSFISVKMLSEIVFIDIKLSHHQTINIEVSIVVWVVWTLFSIIICVLDSSV